jgi:uncharacterized protein
MFASLRSTFAAALALAATVAISTAPALARDSYVFDGASLFSADTVSSLNTKIGDFNHKTGKEVVVVTVPSLDGDTVATAAEHTFADKQVNGVLFFLAKAEKKDIIVGDRASRQFFPSGFDPIRASMTASFRSGNYDEGITDGVQLVLNTYAGHEDSLRTTHAYNNAYAPARANMGSSGGGMSIFWLILILVAGFLIIRAIFRAISGPRVMPPGYGGPGYGGPGYGGPGYGGGYGGGGFGGGGGGFFSGLLGGLGGAFIGNELFNRGGGGFGGGYDQSNVGGDFGGSSNVDSSGWQSDPGQADMGNASSGDWGGGGGDFGGGGDSGGGW